ncbi:Na+/H+ antiporter subunit E [Stigmatella aurantiaca]|uniref:Na(+):H(+) antiporter, putative n=1 Tax=Stigmatella aurantiaca (strain DW4/3-1) TaxID=378806 RepID=Q091J2_STIAD|nr:Na+/H+ antiporter subunit E [Stigmatella aurantiaca]ADO68860.1 Na+/H+ ion antiporter [Stigmatella aurantiaca DW4/3-1]EAU66387.1 Na(+):H(+) antiporter, putative [Stigmatella aurantiaca DW4/3-1]
MSSFLWNLVLAFLWAAVQDDMSLGNLAIGFVLGLLLLSFVTPEPGASPYARKLVDILKLLGLFLREVLSTNWRLAREIATPGIKSQPAIYAFETEARTDLEVTLLLLIINFTPGSLGLELSEDGKVLYVHNMFTTTREEFIRNMRENVERPLLRVLR